MNSTRIIKVGHLSQYLVGFIIFAIITLGCLYMDFFDGMYGMRFWAIVPGIFFIVNLSNYFSKYVAVSTEYFTACWGASASKFVIPIENIAQFSVIGDVLVVNRIKFRGVPHVELVLSALNKAIEMKQSKIMAGAMARNMQMQSMQMAPTQMNSRY